MRGFLSFENTIHRITLEKRRLLDTNHKFQENIRVGSVCHGSYGAVFKISCCLPKLLARRVENWSFIKALNVGKSKQENRNSRLL